MLAPDYLDHAPDRLILLWQQAEDDILRDVARRIGKMDTLTRRPTGSSGATSRPRPSARMW
mgnify:CR=1 FL=1